jgi:transposase
MSMGKRERARQETLWVETGALPVSPGHPFYERVNNLLSKHGFDAMVEAACERFYAEGMGRPSIPPAVYFRMLFIGYFEGIDSERGIAWRTADSMALRAFLGYGLTEGTPDHSSLSRTRRRIDLETHQSVFDWMLCVLAKEGLLKGKTLGVDATTLEANAALRSIVRRDTGESYEAFLTRLAQASGIETPTREDLGKLDRNRPGKGSNRDWQHPHDPDARITKMKDGRTHLAHKAEHAVDMDSGALIAVTLQGADQGDTTTLQETVEQAKASLREAARDPQARNEMKPARELVADKGYHSNDSVRNLQETHHLASYISEPNRGRRSWEDKAQAQRTVYANRQRIRGERGKQLLRKRGELVERSFAHLYETGAMRRTHLRGHPNILKRLLIHAAGFNLSLLLRRAIGIGAPRRLQDFPEVLLGAIFLCLRVLWRTAQRTSALTDDPMRQNILSCSLTPPFGKRGSATGC